MKFDLHMNDNDKDTLTEEDYYLKSIACGCCPQCAKGFLVPRKNSANNELFLGCSSFPATECNFTIDIEDYLDIATNYRIQHYDDLIKMNMSDHLFVNAEEALMSAIEIYNKPIFNYKFQSCIILLINAWELLMKAIICNKDGEKAIWSDDKHTIFFTDCMDKMLKINANFISPSTKENLLILYDIRNNFTHFYCENVNTVLYSLISKAVDEFIQLAATNFTLKNKELLSMQYLPLFFNIKRTTFQEIKTMHNSKDDYIKSIADRIINFANTHKNFESLLYNVDINLQTIKNISNADIIVGINKDSNLTINLEKKFQLGNKKDKGLQKVTLSDEEIDKLYAYSYEDLMSLKVKGKYKEIQQFIKYIRKSDNCLEYCYEKGKHPKRKTPGFFVYSQKCYNEIEELVKNKK